MLKRPNQPEYPLPPIGSLGTLSRMLRCSPDGLTQLANNAEKLYRVIPRKKKDGTTRFCYDALPTLKRIQGYIKDMILCKVNFPPYLMGGLKGRSHFSNADLHVGARLTISEDIADFFPSISSEIIYDIWKHCFRFPPDVSKILTMLTTKAGFLPQGAKTSSYLANLVFWRSEEGLYETLKGIRFVYSRFIDDITMSSHSERSSNEITQAVSLVAAMIHSRGMRLKRTKHKISRSGQKMQATGLLTNERVAYPQAVRSRTRAAVQRCEAVFERHEALHLREKQKRSAQAKVGQLARFHPSEAKRLKARLTQCWT